MQHPETPPVETTASQFNHAHVQHIQIMYEVPPQFVCSLMQLPRKIGPEQCNVCVYGLSTGHSRVINICRKLCRSPDWAGGLGVAIWWAAQRATAAHVVAVAASVFGANFIKYGWSTHTHTRNVMHLATWCHNTPNIGQPCAQEVSHKHCQC